MSDTRGHASGKNGKSGKSAKNGTVPHRNGDIAASAQAFVDGWMNIMTGLGTAQDKTTGHRVTVEKLAYEQCEALYRGSDMGARIVEEVPNEMCREGWQIEVENDKETAEAADQKLEDLATDTRVHQALCWARAFGGAGVILGVNDGVADIAAPLDEANIQSVDWLSVLDARELVPWTYYTDPLSPRYGEPSTYKIMPYTVGSGPGGVAPEERNRPAVMGSWREIHTTRILPFRGVITNRYQQRETWGWGESIFVRAQHALAQFDASFASAAALVQDFAQAICKIRGLAELLANNQDNVVLQRMSLMQMQRSVLRMVMLDAGDGDNTGEDFERKPTPVTGLTDILDRMALRLAASVDMPITRLMGQQPAGLNATGDNDIRRWYDQVRAGQQKKVKPQLKRLVRLLFLARDGPTGGVLPAKWSVDFRPLWQLDDGAEATRRFAIAQADNLYIQNGTLTPAEVAATRFGGDSYNGEGMNLDTGLRAQMEVAPAGAGPADDPNKGNGPDGTEPEPTPLAPAPAKTPPIGAKFPPSDNMNPVPGAP